jgi:hypothetical protein
MKHLIPYRTVGSSPDLVAAAGGHLFAQDRRLWVRLREKGGKRRTGSAPPVNTTSAIGASSQPAIGKTVRSASFGVVMIL